MRKVKTYVDAYQYYISAGLSPIDATGAALKMTNKGA